MRVPLCCMAREASCSGSLCPAHLKGHMLVDDVEDQPLLGALQHAGVPAAAQLMLLSTGCQVCLTAHAPLLSTSLLLVVCSRLWQAELVNGDMRLAY